jgi:hypothetical protein
VLAVGFFQGLVDTSVGEFALLGWLLLRGRCIDLGVEEAPTAG